MRAKVKNVMKKCNVCKVFLTKPYRVPSTSALPEYRMEGTADSALLQEPYSKCVFGSLPF